MFSLPILLLQQHRQFPTSAHGIVRCRLTTTPLGLSWFNQVQHASRFVCGLTNGMISVWDLDTNPPRAAARLPVLPDLTSLSMACDDSLFLATGNDEYIALYDPERCVVSQKYKHVHRAKVNVGKFARHDPHLFATSSLDGTGKLFDVRLRTPVTTFKTGAELIHVIFANDDRHVLLSGVNVSSHPRSTVFCPFHFAHHVPSLHCLHVSSCTRCTPSVSRRFLCTMSSHGCVSPHAQTLNRRSSRNLRSAEVYTSRTSLRRWTMRTTAARTTRAMGSTSCVHRAATLCCVSRRRQTGSCFAKSPSTRNSTKTGRAPV